jgi:hypothetical protein
MAFDFDAGQRPVAYEGEVHYPSDETIWTSTQLEAIPEEV